VPPPDRRALAYTAAAVSIFGWGSLYPVAKLALEEVTPLMVALARAVLAGLILALLTCLRNGHLRHGLGRLRREATTDWRGPCVLGLISLAGTSLMAMTAQQFLPAAVNGLLNNLSPLWLALYTALTGRARNAPLLLAGSSLAAVGVALVLLGGASPPPPPAASAAAASAAAASGPSAPAPALLSTPASGSRSFLDSGAGSPPGGGLSGSAAFALGATISLGGSMLIAYSNLVARRVMAGRDPFATTAVAAGWASLPLVAPLALGIGGSLSGFATAPAETRGQLLWLGGVCTAFNFSLWNFALAHLPVSRIAPLQYLIPPLGVLLAILILGEPAGAGLVAGTGAIVAGILLARLGAEPPA
jgi:drug/metabolite transporter (DMT)-like permease